MEVQITLQKKIKRIRKEKEKTCAVDASDNIRTESTSCKCSRCVSEEHLISKCPKPPKDKEKQRNQVRFNEKGDRACDNRKNNNDQKMYASMARMSGNDKCPGESFGDSLQLTNCILDSEATCHMTP